MSSDSPQHVKVRLFRVLGRRCSSGQDHRVHQEATRNDEDSTDSDQSSEERGSPSGRGRRSRCKKGGSAESNSGESSSSGGDGCRSASCSSSSQRGVGSSSDSGSSNGDNSPSSIRVSPCGAAGWGSDGYLSGILIPVSSRGSGDLGSCKDTAIRRHHISAFRKVFQGLRLSTSSLSLSPSRSGGGGGGSDGGCSNGNSSSGDGGGGDGGGREDHRVPRRHHHHHHTHHQHHAPEERERGSSASWSSGTLAESESSAPTIKDAGKRSKKSPRRILRSPVSYTYLRGMSGLPTQRVPRHRLPGSSGMPLINGYEL